MILRWLKRGAFLVYAAAFIVLGLEVLLRLFAPDPDYYWGYRFLYMSPRVFENRSEGVWTFRPHVSIRDTAIYAFPSLTGTRFVAEYDCRMRSNNLGLLQDDDVAPGVPATVVIGDSFTSGQGGCPWFSRLQARRSTEQLVNGGLLGTGIEQWRRLVVHLQGQGVNVKRVLLVAISDDFKRPVWTWHADDLACLDNGPCTTRTVAHPVADAETREQLIARTAVRYAERFANAGAVEHVKGLLRRHSYVYKYGNRANESLKALIRSARQRPNNQHEISIRQQNEAALDGLKALGVPLHVLLIPQRNETGLLAPQGDTRLAIEAFNARAIPFSRCPLVEADYLANDGHPTREGYDKIVDCADRALGRMGPVARSTRD